jgi:hypothetical protein
MGRAIIGVLPRANSITSSTADANANRCTNSRRRQQLDGNKDSRTGNTADLYSGRYCPRHPPRSMSAPVILPSEFAPNRNAEGKSTEVNASVELHSKWSVNLYSTKTERPSFSWWDEKASTHNRYIARLDGNHVSGAWSNYDAGQRGNARGACYDFKCWR